MGKTRIEIRKNKFYINGKLVYAEIENAPQKVKGLLMNARFIQGIFDDKTGRERYQRFGRHFDPQENTKDLIKALPQWYDCGLRAFTVGLQGGGPCYTIDSATIDNNPFSADGKQVDPAYLARLSQLIEAADEIGMVVIINLFYCGQIHRLQDCIAVVAAVENICRYVEEHAYTNVMFDLANEQNLPHFEPYPMLSDPRAVAYLITYMQSITSAPVSCSFFGGVVKEEIAKAADYILIHGNGCSNQVLSNLIHDCQRICPEKPVVVNEDSQDITNMEVAIEEGASWGYYNNMTKQEPPADWTITEGEDRFFAERMAVMLGIREKEQVEDEYILQGTSKNERTDGKMWLRVASLDPKTIRKVEFFLDEKYLGTAYDTPFLLHQIYNWQQEAVCCEHFDKVVAKIYRTDGTIITREARDE